MNKILEISGPTIVIIEKQGEWGETITRFIPINIDKDHKLIILVENKVLGNTKIIVHPIEDEFNSGDS